MEAGATDDFWWQGDAAEAYWLEITGRADLGADLNAPNERESGGDYWSYDFVRQVPEGDVVFHYQARPTFAITHWSRAAGEPYPDDVFWGAHGQAGGRGPVAPYWRGGWRRPLDGPYELSEPVTLLQMREAETQIREVQERLAAVHPGDSLYFPFQLSDTRELRAFQGYLTKFPRSLVSLFPPLVEAAEVAARTAPRPEEPVPASGATDVGGEYRHENPEARSARREPFSVDPDRVDRGLQAHARTQELLAAAVRSAGLQPLSHEPGEPPFDVAWRDGDALVVAEVKSLTDQNEERQLRLALGQVLRYAHLLSDRGIQVRCVIAGEREPRDASWRQLCSALGVTLSWPDAFASLFSGPGARRGVADRTPRQN